ncbi:archease [bacterium]|nr:archease [bacterium]
MVEKAGFEHFSTTADAGFRLWAPDLNGLFQQAGLALLSLMTDIQRVQVQEWFEVTLVNETVEDLLIDWLNELIFRVETKGFFFSEFTINQATSKQVDARIGGETIDPAKHLLLTEVKAATYHQLAVTGLDSYQATIIVDV